MFCITQPLHYLWHSFVYAGLVPLSAWLSGNTSTVHTVKHGLVSKPNISSNSFCHDQKCAWSVINFSTVRSFDGAVYNFWPYINVFIYLFLCFCHPTMSTKPLCYWAHCPPHLFILLDKYCYHDTSWTALKFLIKLTGNIYFILEVRGQGHGRPSRLNLVNTIAHELLQQSRWNLQGITTSPSWWPD